MPIDSRGSSELDRKSSLAVRVEGRLLSTRLLLAIGLISATLVVGCYVLLDWLTYNYRLSENVFSVLTVIPLVLLLVAIVTTIAGFVKLGRRAAPPKIMALGVALLSVSILLAVFAPSPNVHGPFAVLGLYLIGAILIGIVLLIAGAARSRCQNSITPDANAEVREAKKEREVQRLLQEDQQGKLGGRLK